MEQITTIDLDDEAATVALACRFAERATRGDVIALSGGVGVGKTVFARAFIRARCAAEVEVPSPTFTLVQVYEPADDGPAIWHFDFFRLERADDAVELGIDEAFGSGITLIEWPEQVPGLLPDDQVVIRLEGGADPGSRRAVLRLGRGWSGREVFHAGE